MALHSGSLVIRVALIVPLISLLLLLHPEQSYACTCLPPDSPSAELSTSAAVFMGRVVSVREFERDDGIWSSIDPTAIEFAVSKVWKGLSYETMFLTTRRSDVSCGFPFVEGEIYVVYSRDGSTVSLCSRTRLLLHAQQDLAELGEGHVPTSGTIAPTPILVAPGGGFGEEPEPPTTIAPTSVSAAPRAELAKGPVPPSTIEPTPVSAAPKAEFGKGPVPPGTTVPTSDSSPPWQTWAIIGPVVLLIVGLMIGAAWLGLRKRRSNGL